MATTASTATTATTLTTANTAITLTTATTAITVTTATTWGRTYSHEMALWSQDISWGHT